MAQFTDSKQREWEIRIDAPTILKIREECDPKFLLSDEGQDGTYARIQSDPALLCRVIFILCAKQRAERSVMEEDFYLSLSGDAIDSATDAMLKAIVSFTPRRTRELLEVSAAKTDKLQQMAIAKALAKINDPALEEQILDGMDRRLEEEVQNILTPLRSATGTADSVESAPTDGR